jgi:hypothetical protein
MSDRERYSPEEKEQLRQLFRDHPGKKVMELLGLAAKQLPARSERALRQQMFKLQRESRKRNNRTASVKTGILENKSKSSVEIKAVNGGRWIAEITSPSGVKTIMRGSAQQIAKLIRSL